LFSGSADGTSANTISPDDLRSPQVAHLTSVHHIDDERIFLKECRALRAAGFDVTLIGPSPTNCQIDGVHIVRVPTATAVCAG
jgi:hypothetical protein